jgi:hypothetical protein
MKVKLLHINHVVYVSILLANFTTLFNFSNNAAQGFSKFIYQLFYSTKTNYFMKKVIQSIVLFMLISSTIFAQSNKKTGLNPFANVVSVTSLGDLPYVSEKTITLETNKVYIFSGMVDISPNFIQLNGSTIKGNDPSKDGILSTVSGAIIRSTDMDVFMENIAVVPLGATTTAYDLVDNTSTKFCNLFAGCSVVEVPRLLSAGVGSITGFNAIYITSNYWHCKDGLKLKGKTGKFCSSYNYITGISSGSAYSTASYSTGMSAGAAIEFMPDFSASDVDLSNNYFVFSGQTAVKMDEGATIDQGRVASNLFRGVTNLLTGFDSHTPGWEMRQNGAGVPDTHPYGYLFMNDNESVITRYIATNLYTKIAGATTTLKSNSFVTTDNRFTYKGKRPLTVRVFALIGAKAPEANADFSIAIQKNGLVQIAPNASKTTTAKGEGFQLFLETVVDLVQGDYLELFIKNNNTTAPIIVRDLQFRISE